jgi:hypothetical protein
MKLTRKQAFELSIKKWEAKVNCEAKPVEVVILLNECGLCEKYYYSNEFNLGQICEKCPIRSRLGANYKFTDPGCYQKGHPYFNWTKDKSTENAQKVLDLIKSKQ